MKIPFFGNDQKRKTAILKRENMDQILEEAVQEAERTDAEFEKRLDKFKEHLKDGTLEFKFKRKPKGGTTHG